ATVSAIPVSRRRKKASSAASEYEKPPHGCRSPRGGFFHLSGDSADAETDVPHRSGARSL
ncbi:MAG: hypothetical protein ACI3U0_06875, partial [Oscillospiraceae bacterium]